MANQMDNEQLEFDLGSDEKAATVTFENDADGNEEEGKLQAPEREVPERETPEQKDNSAHSDELGSVNEAVQKRIAKLTAKMREAERREQAAVEYAKGLQTQTQTLQQRLVQTDYSRLNEAKSRLDTQQVQLRQIIKKAREEGDIDTETEAQERLSQLSMEQRQVSGWLQQQEEAVRNPAPAQQPYQPPAPKAAAPDPRAETWAERNSWFGQDRMLTYAAWGIHQELIEKEGVDPQSDEYYTELDRRLREEFPKKFAGEQSSNQPSRQQRSAPAVAPASRSSGINSARRTVRLSPSQVAIAKKLGVPLEEYAKYVKE
jgi:hypothetical protein